MDSQASSAAVLSASDEAARRVTIPYIPRKHFLGLHASQKRWKFLVAHRRAGKSVAMINEMVKRALLNTRTFPHPRYGYVGPSFAQTKDLIWGYLKYYAGVLPGVSFSESELTCTLPNGATIALYGGAAAYERMRGLYFDGIVLDEFPLLNPTVLSTVVRPCLADYRGWAIVSGTSNGDDHFHELKKRAEKDDTWEIFSIPVTETDALHPDEVAEMTKDMSDEEYAREMLCRFDAPIEGAYYADIMNRLEERDRGTNGRVPYDPAAGVFTAWDLGIDDAMAIWFLQRVGREIHVIKYIELSGVGLSDTPGKLGACSIVKATGFGFVGHLFPHDIKAREIGSGRSRYEIASELLNEPVFAVPLHRVEDGIQAVRSILPMCYFDKEEAAAGISAMRNYQRSKKGQPLHNWASHGADGFRIAATGMHLIIGFAGSSNVTQIGSRLRRRIRGLV